MKAYLLPLHRPYYGTEINVEYDGFLYEIRLWNCANFRPSPRELASWGDPGASEKDWRENDGGCDGHFESLSTHRLAEKLVELINGGSVAK